jgi:hypothetical protein
MGNLARSDQSSLYERDYYAWIQEQVRLLKAGNYTQLDIENLAEELETLGRSEKRELQNRLRVLLTHLLKWAYQPARRSNSWENSIDEQREQVQRVLRDNPSLLPHLAEAFVEAYSLARRSAGAEMNLSRREWDALFPPACPWDWERVLDVEFYPEPMVSEPLP